MGATDLRLPDGRRQFILSPNGSLSPADARRFLWLVGGMTSLVALYFAFKGFWPILPFAGLEIGVLVWALRASMRDSRRRETIIVDADSIHIEWHDRAGVREAQFSRHWARVRLCAAVQTFPSRLIIESHGKGREVGRFLTEEERAVLAKRLRVVVGDVSSSPALD